MRMRTLAALGGLLCLPGCGGLETGAVAPADIPDPLTLERTGKPNDWLLCPLGTCRSEASAPSPSYEIPAQRLWQAWQEVLAESPRATVIATDPDRLLIMAQDRTPVLRFVDTVTVRVLPTGTGGSTFAAYSHSEVGYSDLGTNRRRLEAWSQAVAAKLAPP